MKILKASGVALAIVAGAVLLAQLVPATPVEVPPAAPPNELQGVGVACIGADPDGGWDRCAWRQDDGTWRIAEYPYGPDAPRWSCRTDSGGPCPQHPQLDHL